MWRESRWILQPGKNVQPQLSSRGGAGDELTDAAAGVRTARFSSQPRRSVCCPELPHCQHLPFWSWAAAVAWDIVTQLVVTRGTRVPAAPTDTRHVSRVLRLQWCGSRVLCQVQRLLPAHCFRSYSQAWIGPRSVNIVQKIF